ncbi:FAD-dependent oxidoreductase [Rhodococcus sp. IEGM 1351]|uniref:FAD-dependent oxidoreductase n=1 Tax=Rhodococcus TaxID=1827 RepID=UPI001F0B65B5|nr:MULTISPECIES: FAD-dependent oxidoreductase [Rhodococcus]MDI9938619.1 FAD-dependent oxidoreductase [Rhodococcus sp. IEGM 1351]
MRPATPDSLPSIGPVPGHRGLYIAAGHCMLGVTLAPATAEGIAEMVTSIRNRCFLSSWQDASDDRIRCTTVRCGP